MATSAGGAGTEATGTRAAHSADQAGSPAVDALPTAGSIGFQLSQLGASISQSFHALLAPLGIEPRQFAMLRYVQNAEGRTQQALAEALHIPPSRMVALIDDMEARRLLERRPNPDDRRARAIDLTPEGERMFERAMGVAVEHADGVLHGLSPGEVDTLAALLRKLVANQGLVPGVHPGLTGPPDCDDPPAAAGD